MSNTITIDNAGRIVLPKPLRDKFRLKGGSKLRIESVGDHLELIPEDAGNTSPLVKKNGLLVVAASGTSCDALEALHAEREEREDDIIGN